MVRIYKRDKSLDKTNLLLRFLNHCWRLSKICVWFRSSMDFYVLIFCGFVVKCVGNGRAFVLWRIVSCVLSLGVVSPSQNYTAFCFTFEAEAMLRVTKKTFTNSVKPMRKKKTPVRATLFILKNPDGYKLGLHSAHKHTPESLRKKALWQNLMLVIRMESTVKWLFQKLLLGLFAHHS